MVQDAMLSQPVAILRVLALYVQHWHWQCESLTLCALRARRSPPVNTAARTGLSFKPLLRCLEWQAQVLTEAVKALRVAEYQRVTIDTEISNFHVNLAACERLFSQPIPVAYTRHTSR